MLCFFDNAVLAHAADNGGDLSCVFCGQVFSQVGVFEATDRELAAKENAKEFDVAIIEQIESTVGAVVGTHGFGYLVEPFNAVGGIVDGGEKLNVAAVGVEQELDEVLEAVNIFLHRRELKGGCPVAVYYLAVVFEKGDVVGGCLDAQHDAVFIVHFNGGFSHVVLDACSLNAGMEIIAEFILVVGGKFAAQKGGDIVGLYCVGGGSDQFVIKRGEVFLAFENDVGGVFDLHEAPMVTTGELLEDGAIGLGGFVQEFVQSIRTNGIGEFLRRFGIFNVNKSVVEHFVANAVFIQFPCQFIVAVEVKLQPEGCPGGYAKIAQAQIRQDEVEVIMQTLALGILEKGFMCFFVVPRFVGCTRLHRRENMHQTWMIAAFSEDGLDAFLFAEILFLDKIDFQAVLSCNCLGVLTQHIAQLLGPLGKIKNTDIVVVEPAGCGACIANIHQGAGDNNTVVARERKGNLVCMAFNKFTHGSIMKQNEDKSYPQKMAA